MTDFEGIMRAFLEIEIDRVKRELWKPQLKPREAALKVELETLENVLYFVQVGDMAHTESGPAIPPSSTPGLD